MEMPRIGSSSVCEAGCLSSPNLSVVPEDSWDLLLFSLRIPKKLVLVLSNECLSNRIDELASESGGNQAKSKYSLLPRPFMCDVTRSCCPLLEWASNNSIRKIPHRDWDLTDLRCNQLDN